VNSWVALLVLVSVAVSLFGYWRAFRLHRRILAIEPAFRGLVTQFLDRVTRRKDPSVRKARR